MLTNGLRAAAATAIALAVGAVVAAAGCEDEKCQHSSDCPPGTYCGPSGSCIAVPPVPDGGDEGSAEDGGPETEAITCATPAECDDADPCTADTCSPDHFCVFTPVVDGTPCADEEICNGEETCQEGTCTPGTPLADDADCDDGLVCNGTELGCAAGVCRPGTPPANGTSCDDGNPCNGTERDCDSGTCLEGEPPADGEACDDGLYCNGAEHCRAGACVPDAPPCEPRVDSGCRWTGCNEDAGLCGTFDVDDLTPCSVASAVCGPTGGVCLSGVCQIGPSLLCHDDETPCTTEYCTPDAAGTGTICTSVPVARGTPCPADDPCLGASGRVCIAGTCALGAGAPCTDGSLCIATSCSGDAVCTVVDPPPAFRTLACETTASGSNVLSRNDVSDYGVLCPGTFNGGEEVRQLLVPAGTDEVEITLTGVDATGALTLLALADPCNPASCYRSSGVGVLTTPVAVGSEVTLYFVVDATTASQGAYGLSVTCR
ncbi:MAG: hypothetical protein HY907_03560 [Deltaproteobacteria bacterium]|nr:hypothetical protein [Deltaproteobacteria bacterium]